MVIDSRQGHREPTSEQRHRPSRLTYQRYSADMAVVNARAGKLQIRCLSPASAGPVLLFTVVLPRNEEAELIASRNSKAETRSY